MAVDYRLERAKFNYNMWRLAQLNFNPLWENLSTAEQNEWLEKVPQQMLNESK